MSTCSTPFEKYPLSSFARFGVAEIYQTCPHPQAHCSLTSESHIWGPPLPYPFHTLLPYSVFARNCTFTFQFEHVSISGYLPLAIFQSCFIKPRFLSGFTLTLIFHQAQLVIFSSLVLSIRQIQIPGRSHGRNRLAFHSKFALLSFAWYRLPAPRLLFNEFLLSEALSVSIRNLAILKVWVAQLADFWLFHVVLVWWIWGFEVNLLKLSFASRNLGFLLHFRVFLLALLHYFHSKFPMEFAKGFLAIEF